MASTAFALYALAHLALFAFALRLFLRHRYPSTVPLLIVAFGLIYDNAMLAAGAQIGHGPLLEQLSVPRFFMHAFGTPLLMLAALGQLRRAGVSWARGALLPAAIGVLTLAMIGVGVAADLFGLELKAQTLSGVVSYGNAATANGPPIAPTVTIVVLIAAGIILWRRGAGPWLLIGSVLQFIAAAMGNAVVIAGNLGELALVAGLVASDALLSRRRPQTAES